MHCDLMERSAVNALDGVEEIFVQYFMRQAAPVCIGRKVLTYIRQDIQHYMFISFALHHPMYVHASLVVNHSHSVVHNYSSNASPT